jgi:putative DNA primase/helicase
VFPPAAVVNDVLASPQPSLPILTGIVEVPVLTKAGTIRALAGYDEQAALPTNPRTASRCPQCRRIRRRLSSPPRSCS